MNTESGLTFQSLKGLYILFLQKNKSPDIKQRIPKKGVRNDFSLSFVYPSTSLSSVSTAQTLDQFYSNCYVTVFWSYIANLIIFINLVMAVTKNNIKLQLSQNRQ